MISTLSYCFIRSFSVVVKVRGPIDCLPGGDGTIAAIKASELTPPPRMKTAYGGPTK
jgi:hypothetical protein